MANNTTYTDNNGDVFTIDDIKKYFGEFLTNDWDNEEFRTIAESIMAECNVGFTASDIRDYILKGDYITFVMWGNGWDAYEKEVSVYLSDSTYITEDNKLVARFSYGDIDYAETISNNNGKLEATICDI